MGEKKNVVMYLQYVCFHYRHFIGMFEIWSYGGNATAHFGQCKSEYFCEGTLIQMTIFLLIFGVWM